MPFARTGNGIGMKIVGGKYIPGTQGQIGAYVAAIYPGGVADQLHGELQEGKTVVFFKQNSRAQVLFVGPLIPLFWTSSDVCPGF